MNYEEINALYSTILYWLSKKMDLIQTNVNDECYCSNFSIFKFRGMVIDKTYRKLMWIMRIEKGREITRKKN